MNPPPETPELTAVLNQIDAYIRWFAGAHPIWTIVAGLWTLWFLCRCVGGCDATEVRRICAEERKKHG